LLQGYEELRQFALGDARAAPAVRGLALFIRSGMAEWMRAWASCATETVGRPPGLDQEHGAAVAHDELVSVLTQMAMTASVQPQEMRYEQ
jgi:hypothetical protein